MEPEKPEVSFPTYSIFWYWIFFSVFSALILVAASTLNITHSARALLITVSITAVFFVAKHFVKGSVNLQINDKSINIDLEYRHLKNNPIEINIKDIRGYEVTTTQKGQQDLIFYLSDFSFLQYPVLNEKNISELSDHLSSVILKLDRKDNPGFKTYFSAFAFSIRVVFLNLVLLFCFAAALLTFPNPTNLSANWIIIIVLFVASLLWKFLFRDRIRKAGFRLNAFSWAYLFFHLFALLMLFPLANNLKKLKSKSFIVQSPSAIRINFDKLYIFKKPIFDVNKSLYGYEVGSPGSRSLNFPVYHYCLTPFASINGNEIQNIWVLQKKTENIAKGASTAKIYAKIDEYSTGIRPQFINQIKRPPVFYLFLYSDSKQKENYYYIRSLIQSHNNEVILEPHWESIDEYRKHAKLEIALIVATLVVINITFCVLAARNR